MPKFAPPMAGWFPKISSSSKSLQALRLECTAGHLCDNKKTPLGRLLVAWVLDAMVGPARQNMRWSGILLFFAVSAWAQQSNIDFSRDIQPVFEARCLACHGAGQQMAGLRLDSGDAVVKGGTNGPVVQAGNSAGSKLIERVTSSKKGF